MFGVWKTAGRLLEEAEPLLETKKARFASRFLFQEEVGQCEELDWLVFVVIGLIRIHFIAPP